MESFFCIVKTCQRKSVRFGFAIGVITNFSGKFWKNSEVLIFRKVTTKEATSGAPTPGARHSWPLDFPPGLSDQNPGVPGPVRRPNTCAVVDSVCLIDYSTESDDCATVHTCVFYANTTTVNMRLNIFIVYFSYDSA